MFYGLFFFLVSYQSRSNPHSQHSLRRKSSEGFITAAFTAMKRLVAILAVATAAVCSTNN